jgi:hypothetical protein
MRTDRSPKQAVMTEDWLRHFGGSAVCSQDYHAWLPRINQRDFGKFFIGRKNTQSAIEEKTAHCLLLCFLLKLHWELCSLRGKW